MAAESGLSLWDWRAKSPLQVEITLDAGAQLPSRTYHGDAGFDLYSVILDDRGVPCHKLLQPGEFIDIGTGIRVALPDGYWADVRGRSSMAWKKRIIVHSGVIDEGYRGELRVLCHNMNGKPVRIDHGERLAQLIIYPRVAPEFIPVEVLSISRDGRGEAGFGSTGR